MQLLIPGAVILALILICDVVMVVFMALLPTVSWGVVAKAALRVAFFVNFFLILSLVGLIATAVAHSMHVGFQQWGFVFFCLSAVETGVAGFIVLSKPWRFLSLGLVAFGVLILWYWYLVLAPKLR